jgi:hypothetical protein
MIRSMIAGALVIALSMIVPVSGASILVTTDSGNIGAFTFTNTGVISGTATILVSVPLVGSTVNTVNGVIIPAEAVKVNTPLMFTVTPTGSNTYALNLPAGAVKTVGGTIGQQAVLPFNLTKGDTPATLPNFFNASGPITALIANNNPLYDFSLFGNGKGLINLTFTATSFTGATSFADFFGNVGSTAVGDGSFSQAAIVVPEPTSVVMMGMGLGLTGLVFMRRRRV